MVSHGTATHKNHLTTTELARLCSVSRFTIINWVNQGKIRAARTVGRHYRIPVSEALSFLETFRVGAEEEPQSARPLVHCWEYVEKTGCERECRDCLMHGRDLDYCFVVARHFGREVIRCKEDCSECAYFAEFFGPSAGTPQAQEPSETKGALCSFVYGVGRATHRVKQRADEFKQKFSRRPSGVSGEAEKA